MPIVHYGYRILHRPASRARVLLNGVPLYERAPDRNVAPGGPITHAFVPGENTVSIELAPAPPSADTPWLGPHFELRVYQLVDRPTVTGPVDEPVLWRWEYPHSVERAALEPKLPWAHSACFTPEGDVPAPIWARASREEFEPDGTPEQHRAVADLYHAFASKDGAGYERALAHKFGEYERYYQARPNIAEYLRRLEEPWLMDPLDPADLRFDRHLDGRVAFVRRQSGRRAVGARHQDDPAMGWGSDLYLTRIDGSWRIFR